MIKKYTYTVITNGIVEIDTSKIEIIELGGTYCSEEILLKQEIQKDIDKQMNSVNPSIGLMVTREIK